MLIRYTSHSVRLAVLDQVFLNHIPVAPQDMQFWGKCGWDRCAWLNRIE